jgi:hypothetical protein
MRDFVPTSDLHMSQRQRTATGKHTRENLLVTMDGAVRYVRAHERPPHVGYADLIVSARLAADDSSRPGGGGKVIMIPAAAWAAVGPPKSRQNGTCSCCTVRVASDYPF